MDLSLITNFRPVTAIKPWPVDPELPAVIRAENSARPGKDSSRRRPPSEPQDGDFADFSGETQTESSPGEPETPPPSQINLFA